MESASDSRSQIESLRRRRNRLVAGVLALLGVATALVSWRSARAPGPGRSLVVDTGSPYQNTRRGVKYGGDAACIRCHAEIGESYRSHPMGRSLSPIMPATAPRVESTAGAALFEAGGLQYSIQNRGGHVIH